MLSEISEDMDTFIHGAQQHIEFLIFGLIFLWVFNVINWQTGSKLNRLGILPRHPLGLVGIVCSPFLHGNFNHLFFNSIPLFALSLLIIAQGFAVYIEISVIIILLAGIGVWIFGRRGIHIGASGLVAGYFGYLLMMAYHQPNFMSLLLGVIVLYYFGGILLSVIPTEEKVSWEGHLIGLISGVASIYIAQFFDESAILF